LYLNDLSCFEDFKQVESLIKSCIVDVQLGYLDCLNKCVAGTSIKAKLLQGSITKDILNHKIDGVVP